MTQRAITANELADVITTWDTDDECSDEEGYEDASGGGESPNAHVNDSDECPDNCKDESDEDDNVMSQQSQPSSTSVFGRDRTEWTCTPSTNTGRTGAHNVFKAATLEQLLKACQLHMTPGSISSMNLS